MHYDWLKRGVFVALACTLVVAGKESAEMTYHELRYTSYLSDVLGAKKSNITMSSSTIGEKRTIKIGNQVCGSVKDANQYERTWHRLKGLKSQASNETSEVKKVHKCCWTHNRCRRIVPAKESKYGFNNPLEYDVMACSCDNIFKRCLKEEKSEIADAIGHVYFDLLKIPCLSFSQQPPATNGGLKGGGHIVSMVPDVRIPSPLIGAAQVTVLHGENVVVKGLGRSGAGGMGPSIGAKVGKIDQSKIGLQPLSYNKTLYF